MKKVQAYKCDHCPKTSTNPSALSQHERRCRFNPNNKHKCFEYCIYLNLEINTDTMSKYFLCTLKNKEMYSYKAEYRGMNHLLPATRMPLECEQYDNGYNILK